MRVKSSCEWLSVPLNPECEGAHLLISRFIDGEIDKNETENLRGHLSACEACRKALEAQSAQSRELAEALRLLWPSDSSAQQKKLASDTRSWWSRLKHFGIKGIS